MSSSVSLSDFHWNAQTLSLTRDSSSTIVGYTSRYTVIKNSWKGNYRRIFCVSPRAVVTIQPNSLFKVTNTWDYRSALRDVMPDRTDVHKFSVVIRKSGGAETLTFQAATAEERASLLTDIQRYRSVFDCSYAALCHRYTFACRKYTFKEEMRPCMLRVTNVGIEQLDPVNQKVVGEYPFLFVKGMTGIIDDPRSLVIVSSPSLRMHLFEIDNPDNIIALVRENASKYLGLTPYAPIKSLHRHQFDTCRLGVSQEALEAVVEFHVLKWSRKQDGGAPVRRILSTSTKYLVERDPGTYTVISALPLAGLFALVRSNDNGQAFSLQFMDLCVVKHFTSPLRDAFLAHILDACRRCGNRKVSVLSAPADRGKRAVPLSSTVCDEVEGGLLHSLMDTARANRPEHSISELVEFFNANIDYTGLRFVDNRDSMFAENREELIGDTFRVLVGRQPLPSAEDELTQHFNALRRFSVTRVGFSCVAAMPTVARAAYLNCMDALRCNSNAVLHAVADFLATLMTPHHDHYDVVHEHANKARLLGSQLLVQHLLEVVRDKARIESASLVVQTVLDFFVYALCPPYSLSTDASSFQTVLQAMVKVLGGELFSLLHHPCYAIRFSAGQLLRVIMEEGTEEQFLSTQTSALSEGGILVEFNVAAFGRDRELRDLARRLIAFWTYENVEMQDLLRRMIPRPLLNFLQSTEDPPADEMEEVRMKGVAPATAEWLDSKVGWFQKRFQPNCHKGSASLAGRTSGPAGEQYRDRQRHVRLQPTLNWSMLFYQLKRDHLRPDLIWNPTTREELRHAIEEELRAFQDRGEASQKEKVAWNYHEFEVSYRSLSQELRVGQHYLRILFEVQNPVVANPKEFFNDLYQRFLIVPDDASKLECLHGMAILYNHYGEVIGEFSGLPYIVSQLGNVTNPTFRDRLIMFIYYLMRARQNIRLLVDCNGLVALTAFVTLAHLHVDRPQTHTVAAAIEYGGSLEDLQDKEKEWYYYTHDGVKAGPVSYKELAKLFRREGEEREVTENTKVWAEGMLGWKALGDVPQLRWGIMAAGRASILSLTEVTCTVLDIFVCVCGHFPTRDAMGAVMRPQSRVKRYFSSPTVLSNIVQLLLTFDSAVCSRVHALLYLVLQDNPLASRFFLTGAFYFSLMYTASDVMPLSRLLYLTHSIQAFVSPLTDNETVRKSILSPLLPSAMVCYLSNHGPSKFANIFLGEYETPECVWGKDMRLHLVGKLASHVGDFVSRLLGNNTLTYQYCPILSVQYERLSNELFCSQYYLRHLCDTARYPAWPVDKPVQLLTEALAAWRREVDKRPCGLTREGCLEVLGFTSDDTNVTHMPSPSDVRKAYYKLAAEYHPDRNPNGRECFDKIQGAYEFLLSENMSDKPNSHNIELLLRTQSLLYERYGDVLEAYKYPGYPLLLQLIQKEYESPEMLHRDSVLMVAATELCFHTVDNVALNADELQEEGGIHLLVQVIVRCFEGITPSTVESTTAVKVAVNCMKTAHVSARLEDCRRKMLNEMELCYLASKGVGYENVPCLARACIQACETLSSDETLRARIVESGAVWHLLRYLLRFDVTLQEGEVELRVEHHPQLFINNTAECALRSLCAVAGLRLGNNCVSTQRHTSVCCLLERLLSPYIVRRLDTLSITESGVLTLLNSTVENPYFIWNHATRTELEELLSANSLVYRDAALQADTTELPLEAWDTFTYSAHKDELVVGGVYLRLFNLQPSFHIDDAAVFVDDLMRFLQERLVQDETHGVSVVLSTLSNMLAGYPQVACERAALHLPVLVKLLTTKEDCIIVQVLQLLVGLLGYADTLDALGDVGTIVTDIIFALHNTCSEEVEKCALQFLRVALASRSIAEQALQRGLYVVLLRIYATSQRPGAREESCCCLAKAFSDKLCGPKMFLRSSKFLPAVMLEAVRDDPAHAYYLIDRWQANPELVWNATLKDRFVERVRKCCDEIVEALQRDSQYDWAPPADEDITDGVREIQVGGVYLQLFMQQAGWVVRRQKDFLVALLDRYSEECSFLLRPDASLSQTASPVGNSHSLPSMGMDAAARSSLIELITDVGEKVMSTSAGLRDYCASLGFAAKMCQFVQSVKPVVAISAMRWLHEMCSSYVCGEIVSQAKPVGPVMHFMKAHPAYVQLALGTLECLISHATPQSNVLKHLLEHQLPEVLLQMLDDGVDCTDMSVGSPASLRALVIKVLKAMLGVVDPIYQPVITALLGGSAVWHKYKNQSHDLFLSLSAPNGYITIGRSGSTGQATASSGGFLSIADSQVPPLPSSVPPPLVNN